MQLYLKCRSDLEGEIKMSEFSSGSLTLIKYKEMISEFNPIYMQDLNDEWFFFVAEDTVGDENTPDCL